MHVRHTGKDKSELVSNGYNSSHNKVRRPRPKFKNSFCLYFCCFWINVTQINFENIQKIQRIISDSCFQLKSRFNVYARAPSIPLLNFPFKLLSYYFLNSQFKLVYMYIHMLIIIQDNDFLDYLKYNRVLKTHLIFIFLDITTVEQPASTLADATTMVASTMSPTSKKTLP